MSKKSAALARVRQLACLGLPGGLFVASLLPLLRELTESDSAAFFWIDESGAIANFYAEHFPLPVHPAPAEAPDAVPSDGTEPAFKPVSVAVLASTIDNEMVGNGWYNEILKRNGAHYILHGIARQQGMVVGRVTLFRSAGSHAFGLPEIAALSSVIRYVTQGLGAGPSQSQHGIFRESEEVLEEEFLIADRAGQVIHATETGRRLLLLSTGCALGPRTLPVAGRESQRLLRGLCAAGKAGRIAERAQVSRDTTWGRFVLRAYCLTDDYPADGALLGVHIRRTQPASLRFVNAMNGLPLSPQQREIALMIAHGGTNRDIAARLSVSVNTVAYHIKQLFYKLRVHDRAELLARISAGLEPAGAEALTSGLRPGRP